MKYRITTALMSALLLSTTLPSNASGQELSREEALVSDLKEAVEMINSKEFDLLIADFLPEFISVQLQMEAMDPDIRGPLGRRGLSKLRDELPVMKADFSAAIAGKRIWNRDKSMVRIQYTTEPIERIPEQRPGANLKIRPEQQLEGFGSSQSVVLAAAIEALESGDYGAVAKKLLPAETAATIDDSTTDRWATKLQQHPEMVKAMVRDLKAALAKSPSQQATLLENVAGQFRLKGLNQEARSSYYQLATANIKAEIIPATTKSMVLAWSDGRWRIQQFPKVVTSVE